MKIKRYFTDSQKHPFEQVKFIQRSAKLNARGQTHIVWAPRHWSQNAIDITSLKYLRKTDVPNDEGMEKDFRDLFKRLAKCWSYWGKKQGLLTSPTQVKIFEEEILYMLIHQMAAPNSPQWFNTGLYHSYKIKGTPQGHWFYDEKKQKAQPSKSAYERPQPHACFIQDVHDHLVGEKGVMELWTKEARLFKYGSGTGTNFSKIRSRKEALTNGEYSAGVVNFLKVGDQAAAAIKSGGTTRRAAKMVILDLDHPDIEEFIDWKKNEEKKVGQLIVGSAQAKLIEKKLAQLLERSNYKLSENDLTELEQDMWQRGFPKGMRGKVLDCARQGRPWEAIELDEDWQGEAYQSVSAQNSNNSVSVPHSFMQKLKLDGSWSLKKRVDGKVVQRIKAQSLWDQLCEAAWSCADPGLQFSGTINDWHTCPKEGRIRASNPCSEYLFLDETACNLASLNVLAFYDEARSEFDFTGYEHAIRLWTIVLEISVGMAQYPTREIAERSHRYRTLGLGLTNIGSFIMSMGLAYDSDHGRSWARTLCSLLGAKAWMTSIEMASHLRPCAAWKENKADVLRVLKNHLLAAKRRKKGYIGLSVRPLILPYFKDEEVGALRAQQLWESVLEEASKEGVRNMQTTLLAPTGTISLVMDCDTTGIEPDYSIHKTKTLAGGGLMGLVNQSVNRGLKALGYKESDAHAIVHYAHQNGSFEGAPLLDNKHVPVFDCAQKDAKNRRLDPVSHIMMVAAVQPFLCGAVSKTVNLPDDFTGQEIAQLYKKSYQLMLKAVAVFREGSKLSWPLAKVEWGDDKQGGKAGEFVCPFCSKKALIPTGTCFVCENCGESTSCT